MYINNHVQQNCLHLHSLYLDRPNEIADSLFKAMSLDDQVNLLCGFYDESKLASIELLWPLCCEKLKISFLKMLVNCDDDQTNTLFQKLFEQTDKELQFGVISDGLVEDSSRFPFLWDMASAGLKSASIQDCLYYAARNNKYRAMNHLFPEASKELQIAGLIVATDTAFAKLWAIASQEVKDYCSIRGATWLYGALIKNQKARVEFLLKENFNVRSVVTNGITPYFAALQRVEVFGEAIVEDIRKKDGGYSEDMVKCRLFGHRFELAGEYFEGVAPWKIEWVTHGIIKTLKELSANPLYRSSFSPAQVDNLVEVFTLSTKDSEQLYARAQKKETLVNAGWNGHIVTVIFTPSICVKINTGTGDKRGISFYKIKTKDQERVKSVIKSLKDNKNGTEAEGQRYFDEAMDKELNLEFVYSIWFHQKVGNCGYFANKCSLLALMIFQQMTEVENINERQLKTEFLKVLPAFAHWESLDRCRSISEALPILKKYPEYFDFDKIVSQIIRAGISRHEDDVIIALVQAEPSLKDWKDPTFNWQLPRLAFYWRNLELFVYLVKLGLNFSSVDATTRESIYDDLRQIPLTQEEATLITNKLQDEHSEEVIKFLQFVAEKPITVY